ncbi:MAG: TIM barrel protein [Candidatus Aenigmatarchaeota archaeon]
MRVLLTINPSKNVFKQIKLAKKIGFDGVEIVLEDKAMKTVLNKKSDVKNLLEELNMFASFHLPFWLNILNKDDFNEIQNLYEIANFFNTFCVTHINSENKNDLKIFSKILKKIRDKKIYFENLFQKIDFLENFSKLNVFLTIDISHMLTINTFTEFRNFIVNNKQKILHFHISDANGFSHSHLPFGKGVLPLRRIAELLIKNFNDRTISFEIFDTDFPEIDFESSFIIFKNLIDKYGKE